MKAFKVFIKPFEAPQRNVKIKTEVNFYYNFLKYTLFSNVLRFISKIAAGRKKLGRN